MPSKIWSDYNKANLSTKAGVDNVQEQISGRYYGCFHSHNISVAAQTAEAKPVRPAPGQVLVPPQVRETAELQKISKRFDIDASVLQTEFERGWGFKELRHAALLSLASGKNINEILRLKENNSWPRVEYLTGITPNDIKAARDRNDARYFAAALGLKEKDHPSLPASELLAEWCAACRTAGTSFWQHGREHFGCSSSADAWLELCAYELDVSREKLDAIREKNSQRKMNLLLK